MPTLSANDILNRINHVEKVFEIQPQHAQPGQVALILISNEEDYFDFLLLRVEKVNFPNFTFNSVYRKDQGWVDLEVNDGGAYSFYSVQAVFDIDDQRDLENLQETLNRFSNSQKHLKIYKEAQQTFIQALRRNDDAAIENLVQDSEKLSKDIEDSVSKFGVTVAMFKEVWS
jgi:hypothetical protein